MDWVDLPGLEMEVLGHLPGLEGSVLGEVTKGSDSDTVAQKLSKLSTVADPRTPVKCRGKYLPAPATEHKLAPTQMPIQFLLNLSLSSAAGWLFDSSPRVQKRIQYCVRFGTLGEELEKPPCRHREVMDGFNQVPKD